MSSVFILEQSNYKGDYYQAFKKTSILRISWSSPSLGHRKKNDPNFRPHPPLLQQPFPSQHGTLWIWLLRNKENINIEIEWY